LHFEYLEYSGTYVQQF